MTRASPPLITGFALLILLAGMRVSAQKTPTAVAIVSAVAGEASITSSPGQGKNRVRLFDWIAAESVIEVAPGATVTLVFASGARYQLSATAKARIGPDSVTSSAGPVRALDPVPPLPRFAAIAADSRSGSRSAAVRIRGATIRQMYPNSGVATMADSTVLRFAPLPDATRYLVEVHTDAGTPVLREETRSPAVAVAPHLLQPGVRYRWEVRTLDRIPQVAQGAAELITLDADTARARAALKQSLDANGDVSSQALLAEIDRTLGLLVEARDEFRAALANAPADDALRQALARVEQQLAVDRDKSER